MKRSTFKRLNKSSEEIQEKIFLEYLKSLSIEIDGEYFLPYVSSINIHKNPSQKILDSLMEKKRIVSLGKKSKLNPKLIGEIGKKLSTEPEKKEQWFWQRFFMKPLKSRKFFTNTSVLYKIK